MGGIEAETRGLYIYLAVPNLISVSSIRFFIGLCLPVSSIASTSVWGSSSTTFSPGCTGCSSTSSSRSVDPWGWAFTLALVMAAKYLNPIWSTSETSCGRTWCSIAGSLGMSCLLTTIGYLMGDR